MCKAGAGDRVELEQSELHRYLHNPAGGVSRTFQGGARLFFSLPSLVPLTAIVPKPFSAEDLAASKGRVTGGCRLS